jgi:hypothetical protein
VHPSGYDISKVEERTLGYLPVPSSITLKLTSQTGFEAVLGGVQTDILVEAHLTFDGQPEKRGFESFRHKTALP